MINFMEKGATSRGLLFHSFDVQVLQSFLDFDLLVGSIMVSLTLAASVILCLLVI